MEEVKYVPGDYSLQDCSARIMSSEIIELGEESKSLVVADDVYVAVGKDDLDVLKWVLDHAVSPSTRVFLVRVFPPITHISTPVGRVSKSQLSREVLRVYTNEENNKRRKLMEKYIRLCNDAKVTVDTMFVESKAIAKAIVDLVPVLNITKLVIGSKSPPCSSQYAEESWQKLRKGEFVKKNAPDYCEVTIIHGGKKTVDSEQDTEPLQSSSLPRSNKKDNFQRNIFDCACFTGRTEVEDR
ncbi:U-box domain-containing protein 33-like isoform X2 [Tripterygium wilfordii]|uniref:U-box domain-containing protein 33-like isoform X2 n=1 Tax=Tripterygium wilfordii TaxID=458696 RepID=UPI0018F7F166|nr:U-box domain-containing protein 33-like isoform X2 [Tripterygium wilfordii]